jgi:hypothetical protein
VPSLRDALRDGRDSQVQGLQGRDVQKDHSADRFSSGAEWVRVVLIPAIERGNVELQPERVAIRLDLNLDPRSTNHAHAQTARAYASVTPEPVRSHCLADKDPLQRTACCRRAVPIGRREVLPPALRRRNCRAGVAIHQNIHSTAELHSAPLVVTTSCASRVESRLCGAKYEWH